MFKRKHGFDPAHTKLLLPIMQLSEITQKLGKSGLGASGCHSVLNVGPETIGLGSSGLWFFF